MQMLWYAITTLKFAIKLVNAPDAATGTLKIGLSRSALQEFCFNGLILAMLPRKSSII